MDIIIQANIVKLYNGRSHDFFKDFVVGDALSLKERVVIMLTINPGFLFFQ